VTIDPSKELTFQQQRDGSLKAYLTIANVSQKNLAYKVKTTAPRYYVVKPNQGILEKGQKINIDITLIQAEVR
jgi:vesicle-associated membrane protein-associated protein B